MSIFDSAFKHKPKAKATKPGTTKGASATTKKTSPTKASSAAAARPGSSSGKDSDLRGKDDATAQLERNFANLAAEKRGNSAVIVGGLPSSKGKLGATNNRLLNAQGSSNRSLPPSPALSGIGSPSLAVSGSSVQERLKQQRFPIVHELAVEDQTRDDLFAKWNEGTEDEFNTALNKVAEFDKGSQKWSLKKQYWKELDAFEYSYARDEDRQAAIDRAIREYDKMRISASDPLWQKLLPKAERGKGICLSRLQAVLGKGLSAQVPRPRPDAASISGGDSEREDPTASSAKKTKGGETMSRSSSQTSTGKKKLSASEAQQKRLLSNKKKPLASAATTAATTTKPAAKTTKSTKTTSAKGGRVLSKEIISDSGSSEDEPLATSLPKASAAAGSEGPKIAPRPAERVAKPADKAKESSATAPKPKPAVAATTKAASRDEGRDKGKDTIRAQVVAKPPPAKAATTTTTTTTKRPRDADDDDSSSSGTPLSKRVKAVAKAPASSSSSAPAPSAKPRTASDASQHGRPATGSMPAKAKNTSPVKSSPLASSPPTNASQQTEDRRAAAPVRVREKEMGQDRERERERERERARDHKTTAVRSSSASSSSSTDRSSVAGLGIGTSTARKRLPTDSGTNRPVKRSRPSQATIDMAARFKQYYAKYLQLHADVSAQAQRDGAGPDPEKLGDLLEMHERLTKMKTEIYAAVEA
ncbi:hypothetical protein VTJ49DRAFT_6149 [Mycothermus thermophilus]|uniref:E3 ubiquitin-protein ligase UBR1-like winged-helix domain-containing protein n=1 Tax=Humicola insolens TaxID=85995 RepID=A0ABR3V1U1_HUMIN